MASELETSETPVERAAGVLGKLKYPSSSQFGLMLAAALFAAVTGAIAFALVHILATPFRTGVGGTLTLLSGVFWAASLFAHHHSKIPIWLSAVAAWLTFLAGVCTLA